MPSYQCLKCRYRFSVKENRPINKCPYCGTNPEHLVSTDSKAIIREIEDITR